MNKLVFQYLSQFFDAEGLKRLRTASKGLNHAVGMSETAVKTLTDALCSGAQNEVLGEFVGPLLFGRPGNSLYDQAVQTRGNYLAARCVLAVGVCTSSEAQCGKCRVSAGDLLNRLEQSLSGATDYELNFGGPHARDTFILDELTCHDECLACTFNPREVSIGEDDNGVYERLCCLCTTEVIVRRRFSSWEDAADLYRTAFMRFVGVNELPNAFEVGDIIAILDEYTLYPQDYVEELLVSSGICYVSVEAVTRRVAVDIVENAMYPCPGRSSLGVGTGAMIHSIDS